MDNELVYSGTASAGVAVEVTIDGATYNTTASGGVWSVSGSLLQDGAYTLSATATGETVTETVVIDRTGPSVAVTYDDSVLTTGETAQITFQFSEAVVSFDANDVDLTNATGILGSLSSSDGGVTWSATFTPDSGVEAVGQTIGVVDGGYFDLAGNTGGAGVSSDFVIDTLAPTGPIYGTDGSDVLTGTDAGETISGIPETGSSSLGAGTIDILIGLGGADTFLFGDDRGIFYDDGNPRAGNTGKSDYGQITDFEPGVDKIQLAGTSDDYFLKSWSLDGVSGTGIIFDSDGDGVSESKDELIGLVVDRQPDDFSGDDFIFV
jgi:hypothetical protein